VRILVVEDDILVQKSMRLTFSDQEVVFVASGEEAIEKLNSIPFNIMFLDIRLEGLLTGVDVLRDARTVDPLLPIIMVSGLDDRSTIIECLELGAVDYVVKGSVTPAAYATAIHKASVWRKQQAEKLSHAHDEPQDVADPLGSIKGNSKFVQELKEEIRLIGKTEGPFLILGETGTGKELVAQSIWAMRGDTNRPFITVNCAELQASMIEGELFGYEKGAFTGATARRIGLFEAAHGGDIFLDEIGELPLEFQAKLLRVLQERKIRRIGSNVEKAFDFRVIAATNRNLAALVAEGKFREDLFYRLNVHSLHLASLRERKEDVLDLLHCYFGKHGRCAVVIADEVAKEISSYRWPGNIRQLTCLAKYAVPYLDGVNPVLSSEIWNSWISKYGTQSDETEAGASAKDMLVTAIKNGGFNIDAHSERLKVDFIRAALDIGKFNRNEAARILGVSRQRLAHWIETLGV